MARMLAPSVVVLVALVLSVGGAGCKQQIGDRCEQNSDCSSGVCSQQGVSLTGNTSGVCLPSTGSTGLGGSGGMGGSGGTAGSGGATDAASDAEDALSDVAPSTDAPDATSASDAPTDAPTD